MSLRADILKLLTTHTFPLSDEKTLQAEMARAFTAAGIDFAREVHLGPGDIIDFMVGTTIGAIGIEVKIKGARRAIFRQVERYCGYPAISEIILATNVPMSLPYEINRKPTAIAALGRGWL
jgi:hypothetical protein